MKNAHCQLLVWITAGLLLGTRVSATEAQTSGWTSSVTIKSLAVDRYLAFGSGSVLYDDAAIHTDIFISFKNGFWIDLWNSTPLKTKWNKDYGTEQDLGIGWNGKLLTLGVEGWMSDLNLSVGVTYFDEPDLAKIAGDTVFSKVFLSKDFKHLSVSAGFEGYTTTPKSGFEGGILASLGVSRAQPLWGDMVCFISSVALVYDDGGYGFDKGLLLRGGAELDWKITERLTLFAPQILYYVPLTVHDARVTDAFFMAGFSWKCW